VYTKTRCRNIALLLVLLLAQGCSSHRIEAPDSLGEEVKTKVENTEEFYAEQGITGKVENNWLKTFNDAELDKLVNEALEYNPNLRAAYFVVEQAAAQTKLAGAALQPTVGYNGGVSNTSAGNSSSSGGIGASWELDVWGRVSAQVQSARSSQRAIEADYAFAKQSLVAEVSKAWFLLIEASQQEQLSKQIVKEFAATSELVSVKFELGEVLRKDVSQARADLNSAKDSHIQAQNAVKNSSRALELLLGRYPSATLAGQRNLPQLSPFPQAGVPAELLQRRPDLIAKEEQLRSAFFAVKDAELSRLPAFTLSVGGGLSNGSNFLSALAAGVTGPIYTGGAIEADIENATAAQKEAMASYEATIISVFKDVETSLTNERVLEERSEVLALAVEDYLIALKDTQTQYELGEIELTLVQIQQTKLDASRSTDLHVKSLLLQNRVNMYLGLGGGFDSDDAGSEVKRSIEVDKKEAKKEKNN